MFDKILIQQILEELSLLKQENAQLRKRVKELEKKCAQYENPKNSGNSSIPPSQDPFRKTKSLRNKTGRNIGGQKGHKGYKLAMAPNPDKVVVHDIEHCACCGNDLSEHDFSYTSRQVFDIPKIKIQVTEHRAINKTCPNCNTTHQADFPKGLVQEAQYGNRIKSLGVYLQTYQMLPFARVSEFIEDLTGHAISQGSFANFQRKFYKHLENYERQVKRHLLQSPVLHADETGIRENGKTNWFHVLSNQTLTYFGYHSKRGKEAFKHFGIIPIYNGNLVHDRFSPYFSYTCEHSLCNAHILRELNYLEETKKSKWAKDIKDILIKSNEKRKRKKLSKKYYNKKLRKFEKIIKPIIDNYNDVYNKTDEEKLAFALQKHKHLFLKFIRHKHIPFDNNQAERDLRMIKVKQKVSGCFRTNDFAQYFARIRGYISTLKKNDKKVLLNILNAFENKPYIPASG